MFVRRAVDQAAVRCAREGRMGSVQLYARGKTGCQISKFPCRKIVKMSVRLNTVCQPCVAPNRDFASILKAGFNRRNANTGVKLRIETECSICFGLLLPDFSEDTVFPDVTELDESELRLAAREVAVLSCGHTFHTQCLADGNVRICPNDRFALSPGDVAHLQSFNPILAGQQTRYERLRDVRTEQLASNKQRASAANELNRLLEEQRLREVNEEEDRLRDLNDGGDVDGDYYDRLEQSRVDEEAEEAKRKKKIEKRRAEKSRRADKKEKERAANAVMAQWAQEGARDAEAAEANLREKRELEMFERNLSYELPLGLTPKGRATFQNVRDLFTNNGIVLTLTSDRLITQLGYSFHLRSANNVVDVSIVYPNKKIIEVARITKENGRLHCNLAKDNFLLQNTEDSLSYLLMAVKDVSIYTCVEMDLSFPDGTILLYSNEVLQPFHYGFMPNIIYKNASNPAGVFKKTMTVARIVQNNISKMVTQKAIVSLYGAALRTVTGKEITKKDGLTFTMLVLQFGGKTLTSSFVNDSRFQFAARDPVFQFERVSGR